MLAVADDVRAWCEKTGGRGRIVTVKIKWADFQQSTRAGANMPAMERKLGGER